MDQAGDRYGKSGCFGNKHQGCSASPLIRKIIALVEHQVTKNHFKRQAEKIHQYLDITRNGYLVTDLSHVMYLIDLLVQRINISEYVTLLEEILEICIIPPVLTKSSDVLTLGKDLQHYFTMLGYLLVSLGNAKLKMLIALALINLLSRHLPDKHSYLSLDARTKFAEKSQLPGILSHFLELADDYIYPKLLQIVHLLTENSDEVCKLFLYRDALNSLITRLEPTWRERYPSIKPPIIPIENVLYYEESSDIICKLLDKFSKNKNGMEIENVKNITVFSLWSLQYVYRLFVKSRHKAIGRNNILVITIRLMELFPNMEIVKSGLAEDIISVQQSPLYLKTSWAPNLRVTLSEDDFTFLQLFLCIVVCLVDFLGGVRLLEDHRIINRMLRITDPHSVAWPQPQVCVISLATMDVLKRIVPHIEDEFIENAGPTIMLGILQSYQDNDSDINILRKCLETLNNILRNSSSNLTLNSILFNNGENIILGLCESMMSEPIEQIMTEKCLGIAFCVLNTLYNHSPLKASTPVIDLIIKFMKRIIHSKPKEPVHNNQIIIFLMDFIWEHIIKSEQYSVEFVRRDGAFLMLDIIQKFSFAVQLVTLGALVDLCEYGHCIPYLITWRGNGEKITHLLMKLFREENEKLKVKLGPSAQISDINYPLMGKEQWIETFCRCGYTGNPACADLFVSCRPKIYALLQMLNVRYAETVEIADEHYKSCENSAELEAKDQVTLLLAENFLALKLGEAWVELKTELDRIPITLTRMDEKTILSIIERSCKWASYLQQKQNRILKNVYHKELIEEQKLYSHLQEARLSEALDALNELKYVARCSERMFRISQKFIRNSQIAKSVRLSASMDVCPQKTYFSKICVTPVFNQTVNVASKVGRNSDVVAPLPVSPTVSNNDCYLEVPEDLLRTPPGII